MAARKTPSGGRKSDKPWRDAILLAVNERGPDNQRRLRRLAECLVAEGLEGDVVALKEIGDRLDGKATQPIAGDKDHDPIAVTMDLSEAEVARRIALILGST